MMKSTCLVLCAALAVALAQDSSSSVPTVDVIPFVANVVKQGCPKVCTTLSAVCNVTPLKAQCSQLLASCPTLCTQLETCITGCGPNCDKFETNCVSSGIIPTPISNVFCPISGQACDVACVVACPQNQLLNGMTQIATQAQMTIQQFVKQLLPASQ